jgi:hypothetical protein
LSPQRYLHECNDGTFSIAPTASTFNFPGTNATLTFRLWDGSNHQPDLPIAYVISPLTTEQREHDTAYLGLNVLDPDNLNLTLGQKELLQWHFRLGHFHMEWIQKLFRVREGDG